MQPLTPLFNDLAQQRERFLRWTFWQAVIWTVLNDEANECDREHKRRLEAQQQRHRRQQERRARKRRKCSKRRPAPKPPAP